MEEIRYLHLYSFGHIMIDEDLFQRLTVIWWISQVKIVHCQQQKQHQKT